MNALIVYGHPKAEGSYNARLRDEAVRALTEAGHNVAVSNLHKMGFNPVFSLEDDAASARGRAADPDLKIEIEKLQKADLLIIQTPIYWMGFPAIVKGWIDRVFQPTFMPRLRKHNYTVEGLFNRGPFRTKKVILSLTTGSPKSFFDPDGISGDINVMLFPLQYTFFYMGFQVLPPRIHYGSQSEEERDKSLGDWLSRLGTVFQEVPLVFPKLENYAKPSYKLKSAGSYPFGPNIGQNLGIAPRPNSQLVSWVDGVDQNGGHNGAGGEGGALNGNEEFEVADNDVDNDFTYPQTSHYFVSDIY